MTKKYGANTSAAGLAHATYDSGHGMLGAMSRPAVAGPDAGRAQNPRRGLFIRPRSITGLLLTSFGLVALPLIVAIVFGVLYVDRLTDQSERLVLQGVEVTRYSKRLSTLLIGMERSARQYGVLESEELIDRFERQTREFDAMLDALGGLQLDTLPDWNLDALRREARTLSRQLASAQPGEESAARPVEGGIAVRYDPSASSVGAIIAAVAAAGLEITDVTTDEPDLEEVFLEMTGSTS